MTSRCESCWDPITTNKEPRCGLCRAAPRGPVSVRVYQAADRDGCLACFDSNLPTFFAPHERAEFAQFLDEQVHRFPYYVVAADGVVRGCGGHFVHSNASRDAELIWGMIHRAQHRRGLGRALLAHRLAVAGRTAGRCLLDTTPQSFGFYRRMGFVQTAFERGGYAPGMHKVRAERVLP